MDYMHQTNEIHHTAIVSPDAIIGQNNTIGPYCIIGAGVTIGHNNVFMSHVSVGQPAQHKGTDQLSIKSSVIIGDRNVFREFVTIHGGTGGNHTSVDDDCFIMACAHIPHDAMIEDKVTMGNCALIGGHTRVMEGANLSLGCVVHQYQVIGAYSIIGMGGIVPKGADIKPGQKYVGNPVRHIGRNDVGLDRNGVGDVALKALEAQFWRWKDRVKQNGH